MTFRRPETQQQALVEALHLKLIAPGGSERLAARYLVWKLAADLDEATVETCRAAAHERHEAEVADSTHGLVS